MGIIEICRNNYLYSLYSRTFIEGALCPQCCIPSFNPNLTPANPTPLDLVSFTVTLGL